MEQLVSNASKIDLLKKQISKLTEINTKLENESKSEKQKTIQIQNQLDTLSNKSFIEKLKELFK